MVEEKYYENLYDTDWLEECCESPKLTLGCRGFRDMKSGTGLVQFGDASGTEMSGV